MKKLSYLMIFLCCLNSIDVHAQDTLSLSEAVSVALGNSLSLQLVNNNLDIAEINNNYGVAGGLPVVTANVQNNEQITSVNQKLNTGVVIKRRNATANIINANVTSNIILYNAGRIVATKQRLAQLGLLSKDQLNSEVQAVIAAVSIGYYDVVRQQNFMRTIDTSIAASDKQLQLIKVRQQVGLANNADLFQAQIDLNVLQQSRLAQELIISQAKTGLLRLLTLPADSSIIISDTIFVDGQLMLTDILTGLDKNADVLAAEKLIAVNELRVKEIGAQRYPTVRGIAGYNFLRNNASAGQLLLNQNFGPVVGVGVAIPIYNGSIFKRQKDVARIDVRSAGLQRETIVQNLRAGVVQQYQAYTNSINQLDSAASNYALSKKLLDLTLLRYQYRQATILEVKSAQQSFELSGFRLVNLSFAAKAAEILLKQAANLLQ